MYIIIYIRPSLVLLLKTLHRLGVHINCILYINIVISVHCTLDFGPLNSLYYNILISVLCTLDFGPLNFVYF